MSKKTTDKFFKVVKWDSSDVFIKDDKNAVHVGLIVREFGAESLIDAAADTVSADGGLFDFFTDDDSETLVMTRILGVDKGELRGANGPSLSVGIFNSATRVEAITFL